MMLDEVWVQGYKSLEDVRIELGRFNVFVGANGAGKTNLLEAIGLLGCAAGGKVDDAAFKSRGVRPGLPKLYKSAFRGKRLKRSIHLSCVADSSKYRVSLNNPIKDPASAWTIGTESVVEDGQVLASRSNRGATMVDDRSKQFSRTSLELSPFASIALHAAGRFHDTHAARLIRALDHFGIYTPFTPMLRGTTPDGTEQQPRPMGLMGGRLADAVRETMASSDGAKHLSEARRLIDWVESFAVGPAHAANLSPSVASTRTVLRFTDRHMTDKRNILSAYDASEGALYVMFLLTLIAHPTTPPIAAIDNVDQALNPRLAKALVGKVQDLVLANDEMPQLLLTGHNAQMLDGLNLRDDRVRLFVVDRDSRGTTTIDRIEVDAVMATKMERAGKSLSQLWTEGWLGGMPNL
jgi:predicted ATPase